MTFVGAGSALEEGSDGTTDDQQRELGFICIVGRVIVAAPPKRIHPRHEQGEIWYNFCDFVYQFDFVFSACPMWLATCRRWVSAESMILWTTSMATKCWHILAITTKHWTCSTSTTSHTTRCSHLHRQTITNSINQPSTCQRSTRSSATTASYQCSTPTVITQASTPSFNPTQTRWSATSTWLRDTSSWPHEQILSNKFISSSNSFFVSISCEFHSDSSIKDC